jgi:hypothetical protein
MSNESIDTQNSKGSPRCLNCNHFESGHMETADRICQSCGCRGFRGDMEKNSPMNDEDLKHKIEYITQEMLIALSEWQAGVAVDYHSAKIKGRQELFDLIKSSDQKIAIDEEYLLECFDAVARYAQDPTELGGMKPETGALNFMNLGIKSVQQIALAAYIEGFLAGRNMQSSELEQFDVDEAVLAHKPYSSDYYASWMKRRGFDTTLKQAQENK